MAGAGPAPSGKRAMDAEINLVPFIDLLSCCICFLLITAVWTEIAKIDVKPTPNLPGEAMQDEPKLKLEVRIGPDGYYLTENGNTVPLLKNATGYPVVELEGKLATLRTQYPENTAIVVRSDDSVAYRELIHIMDACLKTGLTDISVAGA